MSTRPRPGSLDTAALAGLADLAIARAATIPREQHQLMSEGGAPEQVRAVYWVTTGGTAATYYPSLRVPPGVTEVDIEVVLSGNGLVLFTSSVDTVGCEFSSQVVYYDGPSIELATTQRTNGAVDSTNGARGRALTVRTSAVWEWTDVQLTAVITPVAGMGLEVYVVSYAPIHIPR